MDSSYTIYLTQGECRFSGDPNAQMSTVLGSCVAACIWDAKATVGGMNHFLLPFSRTAGVGGSLRYGAHSMETLINGVLGLGGTRKSLQAKLFGGATMSANLGTIGTDNARFAREFLENEEIPCVAEDLGHTFARRVLFRPATGQARVMRVRSTEVGVPVEAIPHVPDSRKNDVVLF